MKRSYAAQLAIQNNAIAEAGYYTNPQLVVMEIRHALKQAMKRTAEYPEGQSPTIKRALHVVHDTAISVENTTTFEAAKPLVAKGLNVAVLNFASAKNPGGGYLNGSSAQEEYLCRSSLLYHCLVGREMYRYHRSQSDCLYSDWVIYAPEVPVIRDDEGALLDAPWLCGVLTSPAPNAGVVLQKAKGRKGEITKSLRSRMRKVLDVAAAHGHDGLVLGAWGCGVFMNDPVEVAALWEEALQADFRGVFREVAFAVFDRSAQGRCIKAFEARLGEGAAL